MLPEKTDTLLTLCQGPFTVIKQCMPVNYVVDIRGNHKAFHTDMLKWYYARDKDQVEEILKPISSDVRNANTALMIDNIDEEANDGLPEGSHSWCTTHA